MDGMGRLEHGETEGVPAVETVTTDQPRTPGIPDMVDVKNEGVVWRGQGTAEHMSKSDKQRRRRGEEDRGQDVSAASAEV